MDYKEAGVDFAKDRTIIDYIRSKVSGIGDFAGIVPVEILKCLKDPFMSITVDGVGTKVLLLKDYGLSYKIAGQDLFATNVNDIICSGTVPYSFADYLAYSDLDILHICSILDGLIECCDKYGVKLVGGETAQMPDMYQPGTFDIAGMCIGFGDMSEKMEHCAQPGDILIGLASNGIHSNGYSLVRKVLSGMSRLPQPIDNFFKPTMIYIDVLKILGALKNGIYGMAHITGGGLEHNIKRITGGYDIELYYNWQVPSVFRDIQYFGGIENEEMYRVFNMGIGFVLISDRCYVYKILDSLNSTIFSARVIGEVI